VRMLLMGVIVGVGMKRLLVGFRRYLCLILMFNLRFVKLMFQKNHGIVTLVT